MKGSAARVFYKALRVAAENWPDSFLAELISEFDINVAARLVRLYSGQRLQIPFEDDVWKVYRNRKIREVLDESNDMDTRNRMAKLFGVTRHRVLAIYREEKERFPKNKETRAKKIAKETFEKEIQTTRKEMTGVSFRRS